MKALTLWQPWATLAAIGVKGWETRGFRTKHRGPLAIHAAKTRKGLQVAPREVLELLRGELMTFGAVVAIADVDQVVPADTARGAMTPTELAVGDWSDGRWGWKLSRVAPLRAPLYVRGLQGLWDLSPEDTNRAIELTR